MARPSRRAKPALQMVFLAVVGTGCAPKNEDMLHFLREHKHKVSAIEYRIGIPDTIAIHAPHAREISGMGQRLQPDGKIHLQLLGDVKVVGMTAKEIAGKLEVLLGRYYLAPKVSVNVAGYNSKKYYVFGQAGGRGVRPYTGRDTLLDAVLGSGVGQGSWTSRVQVIRPSHGETPVRRLRVNVDKMIKKGDWSKNILLEPDDIVYIPPTPVAWLGQQINLLLSPLTPVARAYVAPAQISAYSNVYSGDNRGQGNVGRFNSFGQPF